MALSLDLDVLWPEAETREGESLSAPGLHSALTELLASTVSEAGLSLAGRRLFQAEILRILQQRIRFENRPSIPSMPDREVLVITGLPRSGTTLLHNLLAVDSSNFFVPLWRALYPCPVEADSNDRQARVQAAELQLRFADRLSPSLRRIHPMYPEWPEECITLMQLSGLSDRYTICLRVPSYAAWLSRQAMDEPYRLLRSVVDAIEPTGMRTVLKAPSHLGNVREIRKVWPRSRFLTIRRSPDAAVISFCRLVEASRMVFSSLVDRKEIGPEWCEVWAERARVQMPGGSITLEYSDLVKGPTDVVRDVYQEMGWSFSNDVRSKVADWATRHPAPTGAPTTAAQAYGLERSMILRGFSGSTYT